MELGSLVWFSSREHPFAVRERHCLDLACSCSDAWLVFTEVDLRGDVLRPPLTFEIQIDLRNGRERRSPPRAPEVHALVREFLVRFPDERFREMVRRRQEQRTAKQRLQEYTVDFSKRVELLCYSDVVYEQGGVSKNGRRFSFFFVHDGRDYLIEDHYCPTPTCDCRLVHVEFWERIEAEGRSPRVDVRQRLMAAFTLDGKWERLEFCQEDRRIAEAFCRAWLDECGHQFAEFRRRYQQIKAIGERSRPSSATTSQPERAADRAPPKHLETPPVATGVGRNDPCPCGSGQKFKRCCGRRDVRG